MKRRMVGRVLVKEQASDKKIIELLFVGMNGEEYRIAQNFNWNKLKNHLWETIDAEGLVYLDSPAVGKKREKAFLIKRFSIKRDDLEQVEWSKAACFSYSVIV